MVKNVLLKLGCHEHYRQGGGRKLCNCNKVSNPNANVDVVKVISSIAHYIAAAGILAGVLTITKKTH